MDHVFQVVEKLVSLQEEVTQLYNALQIADERVLKAEKQAAEAHERGAQEKVGSWTQDSRRMK